MKPTTHEPLFSNNATGCPEVVSEALIHIIRTSILMIRQGGNANDAGFCAWEANHIQNLPSLLRSYSRARLERYLDFARSGYTQEFERRFGHPPKMFLPAWEQLEAFLASDFTSPVEEYQEG